MDESSAETLKSLLLGSRKKVTSQNKKVSAVDCFLSKFSVESAKSIESAKDLSLTTHRKNLELSSLDTRYDSGHNAQKT